VFVFKQECLQLEQEEKQFLKKIY